MALCTNCNRRPRPKDDSRMTCVPCTTDLKHEAQVKAARLRRLRESKPTNYKQYDYIVHWKMCLMGVRPQPVVKGEEPLWTSVRIDFGLNISRVPKEKLIDLDQWLPDYTKEQIDSMKRTMKRFFPQYLTKRRIKAVKT